MITRLVSRLVAALVAGVCMPGDCWAQVNSGSNGSDGAFNPTTSTNINMAGRPSGIYQYTSVNIPGGVTVTFTPNANNTPVVWLVQSNCVINGTISVSGQSGGWVAGGLGSPGGFRGGSGGPIGGAGQGPGGGVAGLNAGCSGAYGSSGSCTNTPTYGNPFLIPLVGGSGGGGATTSVGGGAGGGGGGGAILIAASGQIGLSGSIQARGGDGYNYNPSTYIVTGGGGSGGGVRLVAATLIGTGSVDVRGGLTSGYGYIGGGRIRFDIIDSSFGGVINGVFSQGFQPVIIPMAGQGAQLTITSLAGVAVSASPTGVLSIPDAVISAQQSNPIPVVVNCANIPLGTAITVTVRSANGSIVTAVGSNTTGTQSSSTATVLLNVPRGGGLIYATAATSN